MTKITHSNMRGGSPVPTTVPQTTNYVVEDFSSTQDSVDQRLAEFESEPEQGQPVAPRFIDTESQKKLESLIFMGKFTKEFDIAGHKFELSTLTHKENNDIVLALMKIGESANLFNIRVLTLANAIRTIDGAPLVSFCNEGALSDFEKKSFVIDQMQLALVERLYSAYESMIKESDEIIYGDKIKN
ncbi:MAG: hypothetical protein WC523_00570 [Patescibacteria group bacterium]